jgi:hypothetical protein
MGLDYDDPYEGSPNRFQMVGTITHPGADRYGETPLDPRIRVTAVGNQLRLMKYNVTVGKRYIATETRFWGKRSDTAIEATKEHEDKHVGVAKALHDQYQKLIGMAVGRLSPNQDPYRRVRKGSGPSIDTHFDWVCSLARWPDRCASNIRGQSIMCLAAGTPAALSIGHSPR